MVLCKHFGSCGGCSYQDISYNSQCDRKEKAVHELFQGYGATLRPIIKSPMQYEYRNKMEFSFSQTKEGKKFLGLREKKGRVFYLEECLLASSWFTETLQSVYAWWVESGIDAYFPPKNIGVLRTLTLREMPGTGERMVVLTYSGEISRFADDLQADSIILRKQITQKKKPTYFHETLLYGKDHLIAEIGGYLFKIRAPSFFQPNSSTGAMLYETAIEMANLSQDDTIYDLYCGTGTLAIFAAKYVKKVIGIELCHEAVLDARENIERNRISNIEIIESDVGKISLQEPAEIIFVDPPRAGLSEKAIENIVALRPKKILYISCNPVTQAQNCISLVDAGYQVKKIVPVDQFPHTPHVENIALLEI